MTITREDDSHAMSAALSVALDLAPGTVRDRVASALAQAGIATVRDVARAHVLVADTMRSFAVPIVLIGHRRDILAALKLGAAGGLRPGFSAAQLKAVIHAALLGLVCTDLAEQPSSDSANSHALSDEPAGPEPVLTPREAQVLALLTTGASNKQIARGLEMSVHTAKFHVAAIIAKFGASGRTDAVARAIHSGLVGQRNMV